jgi:predicted DNA-binding protein (MmcQ/YjbR family)
MDFEQLRTYCLSLPGVEEDIKWGNNLCFTVAKKIFCIADLEPPDHVSFKVKEEEFEEISQRPGFMPAPYLARAKWVTVTDFYVLNPKQWQAYLLQSYELIKAKLPKKLREELG